MVRQKSVRFKGLLQPVRDVATQHGNHMTRTAEALGITRKSKTFLARFE
ncbi:hypothetical protein [Aromatoleum anaerobium]|uniref:Transposase n=1 Tax=Aromatoleum anaerobium TaxID=182180 RepID=A0ABX1PJL7_9RHOO|nr:hypothetical protein [Aromatoleum anaerobium]MCK0507696.1 hypothetical protein [Aromatoleum anaerobium]